MIAEAKPPAAHVVTMQRHLVTAIDPVAQSLDGTFGRTIQCAAANQQLQIMVRLRGLF